MPFLTRPHFEDRQIVQYSDDVIKLSGITKIAPTTLDFTGSTTGETTVTINTLTGYLNGEKSSGLMLEPARLKISGSTGTTIQNVSGFVLKSIDPYGSAVWAPISGISVSTSACTSPFYTEIIEACGGPTRPIYVSAGRVEFDNGSGTPKIVVNPNLGSLGIGTGISPSERLHVNGGDMLVETSNGKFFTDLDLSNGATINLSGGTSSLTRLTVSGPLNGGITIGHRGSTEGSFPVYGKQGDGFVYSSIDQNGLNIVSQPGSGTEDYIRFFVGQASGAAGTPDLHIQGSGTTKGNVGINTGSPTEKLHVEGSVRIVDGTEQNGYVLTCDTNGVGSWSASAGGGATIDPYQNEGNVNSITWDVSGTSTNYEAILTGNTTLNLTNVRNGDYGTLIVTQDGVGSHTLTFGAGTHRVVNGGGGIPTLTTTAGATDILSFTYNGTIFYWTVGNDYT
tara:strand:+ start:1619 stop:2971 length:1353 start_codon:yes stop_codon:yes gene_type:complete